MQLPDRIYVATYNKQHVGYTMQGVTRNLQHRSSVFGFINKQDAVTVQKYIARHNFNIKVHRLTMGDYCLTTYPNNTELMKKPDKTFSSSIVHIDTFKTEEAIQKFSVSNINLALISHVQDNVNDNKYLAILAEVFKENTTNSTVKFLDNLFHK